MQKITRFTVSILLVMVFLFSLTACGENGEKGIWDAALYIKDTTLGEGATTFKVEVTADDKTVTFTVNTDEKTVGAALLKEKLIEGEQGQYGLYIKKVNGMTADFNTDKAYWAFYVDGEYAISGVDTTDIDKDVTYQLVYSK